MRPCLETTYNNNPKGSFRSGKDSYLIIEIVKLPSKYFEKFFYKVFVAESMCLRDSYHTLVNKSNGTSLKVIESILCMYSKAHPLKIVTREG